VTDEANKLSGKQIALKAVGVFFLVTLSLIPFTTDTNLIAPPSRYTALYFLTWCLVVGSVCFWWRRVRMVREITIPALVMFAFFALAGLFI
jgi:uncharacterized membrane protein